MRLLFVILSLFFLLPSSVWAVEYSFSDYTIDITLEDGSLHEEISFAIKNEGKDPISWVEYEMVSEPVGLEVSDDKGSLNYVTETPRRVIIELRSPLAEGEMEEVTMDFTVEGMVVQYEDKSLLTMSYIPETGISNFRFIVRLPPGSILASEVKKTGESLSSVYPVPSRIHSDGKRIMVEWFEQELSPYEDFRVFLMYTKTNEKGKLPTVAGIVIGILIGLSIAYYYLRKRPSKEREVARLVLGEDEKVVYDLLASHGGEILQDDIAKNTDFSRPKISKLVRRLEEKKIIKKEPYRKTNRLLLTKEFGGRY